MGVLLERKFLLRKGMIMLGGFCTILGLVFSSISMGTNFWIVADCCRNTTTGSASFTCPDRANTSDLLSVNYGLFQGKKVFRELGDLLYVVSIFCPTDDNVCILSCGQNLDDQKIEFDYLRHGIGDGLTASCKKSSRLRTSTLLKSSGQNDDQFLNSSSWTATIVFLSFMLGFLIVSVGLSIYNTATNPIEFWIGPVGIYIANGASGISGFITLCIWGDHYAKRLSAELAIRETVLDEWAVSSSNLGYSYWFVFVALLFVIASTACIRFRNVLRKYEEKESGDFNQPNTAPRNILLY